MPKNRNVRRRPPAVEALNLSAPEREIANSAVNENEPAKARVPSLIKSYGVYTGVIAIVASIGLGVMASGWLPANGALSDRKTNWFGEELPRDATINWNPFAAPPPPAPSLSKELIYAGNGGRLLAVEDKDAIVSPPADLAVWRPSSGMWYVLGATSYTQYGQNGDTPAPGDYDGDGKTDFAVYRPSTGYWYIRHSSSGSDYYTYWGTSTDLIAPADFDGDGKTDLAFYRQSNTTWYIIPSSTNTAIYPVYGSSSDSPCPGDFDGDGNADLGVWRSSNNTFYSLNTSNGASQSFAPGFAAAPDDKHVVGDYDGDGKDDFSIFRDSNGTWYTKQSSSGQTQSTQYGQSGDVPVPNDYDADARVDITVWRPAAKSATWYILQSTNSATRVELWGVGGDKPVPVYYRR